MCHALASQKTPGENQKEGAVTLLDLVDIPACLSNTLGAAMSTTCWAQGSGDVPGGGGQPEEVS